MDYTEEDNYMIENSKTIVFCYPDNFTALSPNQQVCVERRLLQLAKLCSEKKNQGGDIQLQVLREGQQLQHL